MVEKKTTICKQEVQLAVQILSKDSKDGGTKLIHLKLRYEKSLYSINYLNYCILGTATLTVDKHVPTVHDQSSID
jgi:hypothetical protein